MTESSSLPRSPQPRRLVWSLRLTWFSLAALVVLFSWLNLKQPEGSLVRWLVQSLPLLLFLPGLLRLSHRSYSWLCFVALIYLVPALTQVVMSLGYRNAEQPVSHWSDGLLLFLVLTLFFAATLSSRWLQRWRLPTDEESP